MTSPVSLAVNIDDRDVRRGIRKLAKRGADMRPVFLKLKKPFKEDIKDHQKRKEGPDGSWAPRAASTVGRDRNAKTQGKGTKSERKFKRRRKNKLLGRLPTSVTVKNNSQAFTGESKIPWASVHHDGGTVGRGSVLPARPFLFFSGGFLDLAEHEIGEHLELGWKS